MELSGWDLERNEADHLVLGGADLATLAERYGTPLHVVDEAAVLRRHRTLLGVVSAASVRARVCYSYKSNCVPGLLRVLHDEGCGAEVISPYELWLANRLEVPPSQIVYKGVNKSLDDLRVALDMRVGLINVDCGPSFERLRFVAASMDAPVDIGIRIFPPVGWKSHFGVEPRRDRLVEICRELRAEGLVL